MSDERVVFWFRQDLRLTDNPAFTAAVKAGSVIPVYILDDVNAGQYKMGSASRVWLHYSLLALDKALEGKLCLFVGDAKKVLTALLKQEGVKEIFWNRCYEPWRICRDKKIKDCLQKLGMEVKTYNGSLLWEPWEVLKSDGTPYKVFTPYYKNGCLRLMSPRSPESRPVRISLSEPLKNACELDALSLLPSKPWASRIKQHHNVGEVAAKVRLKAFLNSGLQAYKEGRDVPANSSVSKLSPHLHFGEISPNQVWHAASGCHKDINLQCFLSELGWREFSYYLLYHFPTLPEQNFQKKFDKFRWKKSIKSLKAWQKGLTGIPIVDAGMRELWETGVMHNRVRMITASLLTKNLRIDWRQGEQWFWGCLVDADLASNSAGWQWVAGSGADASPYFRIFNPVTQAKRFDPQAAYILKYVPELARLPLKYIFAPWEAPASVLSEAGVVLGKTYPKPVVDLQESRKSALEAFASLKGGV